MAIFDKRYSAVRTPDMAKRFAALESHVIYLQERVEFYATNNDKTIRDLKAKNDVLEKRIAALENNK